MSNDGLQQVFFDKITDSGTTATTELGTERWKDGNKYVYVKNSSASNAVVNQAVKWEDTADFSISPATVAGGPAAGLCETAIDTLTYGWLGQKGFFDSTTTGTISAGETLVINSTAGVLSDATALTGDLVVGYAVADGTANTSKVFINLG